VRPTHSFARSGAAAAAMAGALSLATGAAGQERNLALGSVSSTSGVYPFAVALAAVVTDADNGLNVTTVEGGGGFDHARLMRQGVVDLSVSGSPAVVHAVTSGTGAFEADGAWDAPRLMFMRNVNVTRIYVRQDEAAREGIATWADLAGKTVVPGVPGTRDMDRIIEANDLLGTGAVMLPASLEDANSRLAEGRVSAVAKGSPNDRFDPAMQALHFSTPLTVVGFSEEEAARIAEADQLNTFIETPAGGVREAPEVGPMMEMSSPVMVMASSNLPQDVGHAIAVAVVEGWGAIGESFPAAAAVHPIRDVISQLPDIDGLYLHAGVVAFALANGFDVPERLIPPEYVASN
jgi:TRAP transporter TAXI family solute receptor